MNGWSTRSCAGLLGVAAALAGCGGGAKPATVPPGGAGGAAGSGTSSAAGRPHLAHCVLHSGSSSSHSDPAGGPAVVACDFDAECIAQPGHGGDAPTDGFIGLTCDGPHCRCEVTSLAAGAQPFTESFDADVCTDSETVRKAFLDHCMAGSELEPE
ncbi:MAG TPA: hypothetical protein VHE35_21745 [Kofleriaceae bacterium]|nr:hypothetical protein [Kofleriaceae bacterium]